MHVISHMSKHVIINCGKEYICIYAYILWFWTYAPVFSFYVGSWDLNSGPQACVTISSNHWALHGYFHFLTIKLTKIYKSY